jgi:hypothetical protein
MRNAHHRDARDDDDALRRVLLVTVAPLPLRTLAGRIADRTEVRSVRFGEAGYDEAVAHFRPHTVVVDLTNLGSLRLARDIAGLFLARGARIVFLGYAHDPGPELALSQEMDALYNPPLDDLVALVVSGPPETHDARQHAAAPVLARRDLPDRRAAHEGATTGEAEGIAP